MRVLSPPPVVNISWTSLMIIMKRFHACCTSPTGFSVRLLWALADFSDCSSRFTVRVSFLPQSDLYSSSEMTSLPHGCIFSIKSLYLYSALHVAYKSGCGILDIFLANREAALCFGLSLVWSRATGRSRLQRSNSGSQARILSHAHSRWRRWWSKHEICH